MILLTGAAGFIGSNFVLHWLERENEPLVNLDKLTYAGNPDNLASLHGDSRYRLVIADIGNRDEVRRALESTRPRAVMNFAAESHVDRSIHGPEDFINTNVVGTFHLLQEVRGYWQSLPEPARSDFRFLHISTDEVYGSLAPDAPPFTEDMAYAPNSPYSASKAASDHLVRAFNHTYGLPTITTNCSNNYGPFQFPEKLIPLMIVNAIVGKPLPVYGDGMNVRDWLYVRDHCSALQDVLARGRIGETYNVGGASERANIDVVRAICAILDELHPTSPVTPHDRLISFVKDRPGHDRRYAIDSRKVQRELGWAPKETFETGLRKTIQWYLDNQEWLRTVTSGDYRNWVVRQYGA